MEITLPAGWRLENPPPEGSFLSASKGEAGRLLAFRADSKSADDAFNKLKKAASDNFGSLTDYSEKVKFDEADGRHARLR